MVSEQVGSGVAVVTGAGSGIGEAIARRAAARGMGVALADVAADRIDAIARELTDAGHDVIAVPTDVTDPASVEALADAAYERFGQVSLLANNAGVESLGNLWEIAPQEWDRLTSVNIDGVFHAIRAFVPRMGADPRPSHVVNTTSVGGIGTTPGMGAYAVSKHGAQAMTECLYLECAGAFPQITVSAFVPAQVSTRIFEDLAPDENTGDAVEYWRSELREKGMTPDQAAGIFFDGVDRKDFWIITHPESFERLAGRRSRLLAGALAPDAA
ncbi:SDR family NAD(P)-dependent oxidoreductase [Rhodococcus sp. D2-41]|uniref:SDR family NAD(P)-dependent oxidoreductase n=1 Tax=Speluncibacter jeojiensis TaxID=2710754 RepID=A0A9X4REP9_9ACTN|nr:SDR family NAD(P)-dependent oxidoreductase [Rhodococcus sp. D2-41]MDG3008961.1 SDR family NAD(P)-dependent oxidoreductase [Rhodococcus sp. D2-41]MDG3015472.1 SDR family NAD(P)-dependent oxidoreductase [Corynebacteriales bacterium D3-21]